MNRMLTAFNLTAVAMTMVISSAAFACPPPPPPPQPPSWSPGDDREEFAERVRKWELEKAVREASAKASMEAYAQGFQNALYAASPYVVMARVVEKETGENDSWGQPRIISVLKIDQWIKGEGADQPIRLHYRGLTSCGPYGAVSAVNAKLGEQVLLFSPDLDWSSERVASVSLAEAKDLQLKRYWETARGGQ